MSSDNGIYILQSKDGFRVAHLQVIDNLFWWYTCCQNPDVKEVHCDVEGADIMGYECENCKTVNPCVTRKDKLSPEMLKEMFGSCKVLTNIEEARIEAIKIYKEIRKEAEEDGYCFIIEYGIQVIVYDKEFPNGR